MAAAAKFRLDYSGVTTGGTSTAYTLTSNQVFGSLANLDGNVLCIIPHATNGAAPTLAVDGLAAKAINKSTGVAVETGALLATSPYFVRYKNSSNEFILVDQRLTAVTSSNPTGGIGYATGAGSTVTQSTSKSTGVTINTVCGTITTHNETLTVGSAAKTFTVTNSTVAATDTVILSIKSNHPVYNVRTANITAGSFDIVIHNDTSGSPSDAIEINFAVIKAVQA